MATLPPAARFPDYGGEGTDLKTSSLAHSGAGRLHSLAIVLYGGTLLVSALLMFLIQPMFAKMALPRLGGSASVWSLALVFFQAVLLCGYGYAHVLAKWVRPHWAGVIHGIVMVDAALSLPIAIAPRFDIPPDQGQALWLISLFASSVGLPFFAISANAPLLQAWFSRLGHANSHDPYFLYAASNVGSFAALIAYPFAIEPFIGLAQQLSLWTIGYVILFLLLCACGAMVVLAGHGASHEAAEAEQQKAVSWRDRLTWIALAFVPSGLLVGVTAHISTDLAAAPFLWIVPLALYLLTFVIAFQQRPWISHDIVIRRMLMIAAPVSVVLVFPFTDIWLLPIHLVAAFTLMLACHGELIRFRPAASHLTEFYLLMSLGGVLGGSFASLIAPVIFSRVLEYPLLVASAFALIAVTRGLLAVRSHWKWYAAGILPLAIVLPVAAIDANGVVMSYAMVLWLVAAIAVAFAAQKHPLVQSLVLAGIILVYPLVSIEKDAIARERSFYGINTVYAGDGGRQHLLAHGVTKHGSQRWLDNNGARLSGRPGLQSYYYVSGPYGSAIRHLRATNGGLNTVAIVGLGTGTQACFAEPGESWKFFEIDPSVINIARNAEYFTFLKECGASQAIVAGDGRLRIQQEPKQKFDLIILDAFSSDSVPVHLLTANALDVYLEKLKPQGSIIFHISNKFMDLTPVIYAAAKSRGLTAYFNDVKDAGWKANKANLEITGQLAVVGKTAEAVGDMARDPQWTYQPSGGEVAPWTDDYSNVLGAIWRKFAG